MWAFPACLRVPRAATRLRLRVRSSKVERRQHDAGCDATLQPPLHDGAKRRQQQAILCSVREWGTKVQLACGGISAACSALEGTCCAALDP